ncbi:MAG: MFS transporter, partial [bacterium]
MSNRWAVLGLLCCARISMGLHFQSVAAVAPLLTADLRLTYGQLGMLIGFYTVPGILLALPGGLLGARFGDRAVVLAALGLLTLGGALFANSTSFAVALLGRLTVGAGGVILSVQLTKMTTDWFVGREISTALGLLLSTWPLGLAVALATLGKIATATSWQAAMYATAAYSGLALLLVMVFYRDPASNGLRKAKDRVRIWTISASELGLVSLASLSWMFLNAGLIVYMSFAPTLLMEQGRSLAAAGIMVSWASLVSIGSLPLAGYLTDRTRHTDAFIAVGAVLAAA